MPAPLPPSDAAPGLAIPPRLGDGSYATPNRALSPAAAVWHLRAALNVAALGCDHPAHSVSGAYNRLLKTQKRALAEAHLAARREHGEVAAFDGAMTRLYNYFAQPPAQAAFCTEARAVLAEAATLPAGGLTGFAAEALARLDRPFAEFYAAYDRYRADLADWRADGRWSPWLRIDPAVFLASQEVTGGSPVRYAARGSAPAAR